MKSFFFKKNYKKNQNKAFTLIELSVVITIIAIVVVGVLSNKVAEVSSDKVKITNDRIREIYKAMGNYLLINGKLPCPAPITNIKSTSATYGTASASDGDCALTDGVYQSTTSGVTNLVYGMVPTKTLGLSEDFAEDGFESKFDYIVNKQFTSSSTFGTAATSNTSSVSNNTITTDLSIFSSSTDLTNEYSTNSKAIFVIISHGSNKLGSFSINSSTINTASTEPAERYNSATNFTDAGATNTAVFSKNKYISTSSTSSLSGIMYYKPLDDIVFGKTRDNMVKDFNAFSTIPCKSNGYNSADVSYTYNGVTTNMTWPQTQYNQIALSNVACPAGYDNGVANPTKKCGPFGVWQAGTVTPCN